MARALCCGRARVIQMSRPTRRPRAFSMAAKGVVVRAGHSVTANFPDYCK
jgi:hypothetical protein